MDIVALERKRNIAVQRSACNNIFALFQTSFNIRVINEKTSWCHQQHRMPRLTVIYYLRTCWWHFMSATGARILLCRPITAKSYIQRVWESISRDGHVFGCHMFSCHRYSGRLFLTLSVLSYKTERHMPNYVSERCKEAVPGLMLRSQTFYILHGKHAQEEDWRRCRTESSNKGPIVCDSATQQPRDRFQDDQPSTCTPSIKPNKTPLLLAQFPHAESKMLSIP